MKFTVGSKGQLGLFFAMSLTMAACNQSEEFFPTQEFIVGPDAFCSEAKDLNSCLELGNACRPAFEDSVDETQDPLFSVCVANPDYNSGTDGNGEESDGSTSSGSSDGTSGGGSNDGSSTAGSSGGSSSGSSDGSVSGGSSGGDSSGSDVPPTLEEAWASKCSNLDERYLWVKKIVDKDRTQVIKKVKVCHMSGNGSSHTIVIACPALKAHISHQDSLGVCKE
jgi:hypothetical protein